MPADRWWRGYDLAIAEALPAGSRILDVGCGDGDFVRRLAGHGLDAVGVDPRAPAGPHLIQTTVEELGDVGPFDAITAMMSLHHVDLERVVAALRRLLRSGGWLFAYEFAWEAYDERAAAFVGTHGGPGAASSVVDWRDKRGDLHTGDAVHAALDAAFALHTAEQRPYLARMISAHELEQDEQALIDAGALPALGRWYVGHARADRP